MVLIFSHIIGKTRLSVQILLIKKPEQPKRDSAPRSSNDSVRGDVCIGNAPNLFLGFGWASDFEGVSVATVKSLNLDEVTR
jgi:hypothetical protein